MPSYLIGIRAWIAGEITGTFLLVFCGCGSVASSLLTGVPAGNFQVAMVWGLGLTAAIYLTRPLSGAHLNPAVTVALALCGGFPGRRVLPYILAQLAGAILASAVLFLIFRDAIAAYESTDAISRGSPGSEATAMIFGEYFPNPGGQPLTDSARQIISLPGAFMAELIGTAVLLFVICGVSDARNASRAPVLVAAAIGLTLTLLISFFGPLTMAGFNPARDFSPRLFSSLAGWKAVPFTANGLGWLTVYIIAPLMGGIAGVWLYNKLRRPRHSAA